MSQIEQLLKYQQEDEKLIKLEQEAASSEERKNYVQAKNFMVKAPSSTISSRVSKSLSASESSS